MRKLRIAFWTCGALVAATTPGLSHHSFAMFDDRPTPLEGTVVEFKFISPHTFITLRVKDNDGHMVNWTLEGPSPSSLVKAGWSAKIIKPGDHLKMTVYPLRSGSHGAVFYPAYTRDKNGKVLGNGNAGIFTNY